MATAEITTEPRTLQNPPAWEVLAACGHPLPARINHTAAAQLLGDEEYDAMLTLTHNGELAAIAYHIAVQRYARAHAGLAAPICDCELCCAEFGEQVTL